MPELDRRSRRHCVTPLGAPRNENLCWRHRETPDRYESFAPMEGVFGGEAVCIGSLVHDRAMRCDRCTDHGNARTNGYVVLTHDLDFSAILAATRGDKPSVVQIRSDDISPEAIGAAVADALAQMSEEPAAGALLAVDARRARVRPLPLLRR